MVKNLAMYILWERPTKKLNYGLSTAELFLEFRLS